MRRKGTDSGIVLVCFVAVAACVFAVAPAHADGSNGGRLWGRSESGGGPPETVFVTDPRISPKGGGYGKVMFKYSDGEFVDRQSIAIKGAFAPTEYVEFKVAPRLARVDFKHGGDEIGIGDTRVGVRFKIPYLSDYLTDLTLGGSATLPTGDEDKWLGQGEVGWGGSLAGAADWNKISLIGRLSIGYRDEDIRYGAGAETLYRVSDAWGFNAGLKGTFTEDSTQASLGGGVRYNVKDVAQLSAGVSVGLTDDSTDLVARTALTVPF